MQVFKSVMVVMVGMVTLLEQVMRQQAIIKNTEKDGKGESKPHLNHPDGRTGGKDTTRWCR